MGKGARGILPPYYNEDNSVRHILRCKNCRGKITTKEDNPSAYIGCKVHCPRCGEPFVITEGDFEIKVDRG